MVLWGLYQGARKMLILHNIDECELVYTSVCYSLKITSHTAIDNLTRFEYSPVSFWIHPRPLDGQVGLMPDDE